MTALVGVGVGILVLLAGAIPNREFLHPSHDARLRSMTLLSGFLLTLSSLWLGASPTLLMAAGRADLAEACQALLNGALPGGRVSGWAMGLMALSITLRSCLGAMSVIGAQRKNRVDSVLGFSQRSDTHELIVLPTSEPWAYAVAGRNPQVVLSSGLVRELPFRSVRAIEAHEISHLENNHHRFLILARVVGVSFGWIPCVEMGAKRLRLSLERWADEDAASQAGRQNVRDAIRAVVASLLSQEGVAAFGGSETIALRIQALDNPRPSLRSRGLLGIYLSAGVAFSMTVSLAVWSLHGPMAGLLVMSRCCHL